MYSFYTQRPLIAHAYNNVVIYGLVNVKTKYYNIFTHLHIF